MSAQNQRMADKSFVSLQFAFLLNITCSKLDLPYEVEVATGQPEIIDSVYLGCKITLENHNFDINLLPMTLGSSDIIVGMDWLSPHHAKIICGKKLVRIPLPSGRFLKIKGEKAPKSLHIISCIQAHKYLTKGHHAFIARIETKPREEKQLKDILVVCDFPEVFSR